jgi:hypothetical protein
VASRAESRTGDNAASLTDAPTRLGGAIRASFSDYYFNSMRLVPANVVWGGGLVGLVLVALVWPLGGLLLLPLLALPTAGIFRLAARIVRVAPDPGLRDVLWPYRHATGSTIALGAALVAATVVLGTNLVAGIAGQGDLVGWALATLAAWGLVAIWAGALVAWPLVVDPVRDGQPLRAKLRLAAGVFLLHPARIGALAVFVALATVVSTILTAALLTISVAFIALVACRVVYPTADRLDLAMAGERP